MPTIHNRTTRLVGTTGMARLSAARVIVFGVGGVGSWCAEGLLRSGVGHLTLVDPDTVCESNLNRQLPALHSTLGQAKVEVLRDRFLDIRPDASVAVVRKSYTAATSGEFRLQDYDYVVDAIDSLADKAHLILTATRLGVRLFSSMGAALKIDPERIRVAEFWKVKGCPLAAALRRRFKKGGEMPRRRFRCVYSEELCPNLGEAEAESAGAKPVNGSIVHATAIFGFTLAGLLVKDVLRDEGAHREGDGEATREEHEQR